MDGSTAGGDRPIEAAKATVRNVRRHSPGEWWTLVRSAASAWSDDYAPSMGAALSYYTVFSLAPLLLIVIAVAGLAFGADAVRGEIFGQLRGLMGADAAKTIEDALASVSKPGQGAAATAIGVVVALVGATTVFAELQDALDRIWRAPARAKTGGVWGLLRARLLSLGMILGIAFLLMVSLVLGAVVSALGKWWDGFFAGWEVLALVVNAAIGFGLTTLVFAMIYKLMPRVHVRWHDVMLGAVVTAGLFTIGKFLIGLYIGKSGVASTYGAAGSIVVVLVWVYYSAQIFLMGAEFTWVYARTFGSMAGREAAAARAAPAAAADGVPARSAPPAEPPLPPLPAPVPAPLVRARPRAVAPSTIGGAGVGIAAWVMLRFVIPRLLRRL